MYACIRHLTVDKRGSFPSCKVPYMYVVARGRDVEDMRVVLNHHTIDIISASPAVCTSRTIVSKPIPVPWLLWIRLFVYAFSCESPIREGGRRQRGRRGVRVVDVAVYLGWKCKGNKRSIATILAVLARVSLSSLSRRATSTYFPICPAGTNCGEGPYRSSTLGAGVVIG